MIRYGILGTSLLVASAAWAEDVPSDEWFSSCDSPRATCVSPRISGPGEEPPVPRLCGGQETGPAAILHGWAEVSQTHLRLPEAERMRLQRAIGQSGQEAALTCELQGPIDAAALEARYHWRAVRSGQRIELTGCPQDQLERAFYSHFVVTLDAESLRPLALCIHSTHANAPSDIAANSNLALRPWTNESMSGAAGPILMVGHNSPVAPTLVAERTAELPGETIPARLDFNLHAVKFSMRQFDQRVPAPVPPAPSPCLGTQPGEPLRPLPEPVEAPRI